MTEKLQVYKCEVCGNIVEVLHGGKGELVCCGTAHGPAGCGSGGRRAGEARAGVREDRRRHQR